MKIGHFLGMVIGIPAFGWFISLTDWRVGLALFLVLFANNLSQRAADGVDAAPNAVDGGSNSIQENDRESPTAQAPDVGVNVAGVLALQPAGREASSQAVGPEGAQEPCGHMKRGLRKWYCRRCMAAAYPGVPHEEAARRFRAAFGVMGTEGGQPK